MRDDAHDQDAAIDDWDAKLDRFQFPVARSTFHAMLYSLVLVLFDKAGTVVLYNSLCACDASSARRSNGTPPTADAKSYLVL